MAVALSDGLNLDFGQRRASGAASWHDVTAAQFT